MEIKRFFVEQSALKEGKIYIEGDEFLHLRKVLRLKVGYKIVVSTGDSIDYFCTLTEVGEDCAVAVVDSTAQNQSECKNRIVLYCGILQNNKLDFVVQKAVELGVARVVPFVSQYCSVKEVNAERLQRISLEASKQCGRACVMEVAPAVRFEYIFQDATANDCVTKIMPCEFETELSFGDVSIEGDTAIIIGSEGGFSESEAAMARAHGWNTVSLGKRILRAETASLTTVSLVMFRLGEMSI